MRLNVGKIILILGLLLVLASFAAYAAQAGKYAHIPAGASAEEITRVAHEYGLDRPLALQYGIFLLLFLPGVILLGAFGTSALPKPAVPINFLVKAVLFIIMFMSIIRGMFDLLQAPRSDGLFTLFWWMMMTLSALGLANYIFALAIWNGKKWGIYGLCLASGLMFLINIFSGVPFLYALFTCSVVPILLWLIWPVIWKMV